MTVPTTHFDMGGAGAIDQRLGLVGAAKAVIGLLEEPNGEPVSWPLIYAFTSTMFAAAPMQIMWASLGFDPRSMPGPLGKLPWVQPDELNPSPGEI